MADTSPEDIINNARDAQAALNEGAAALDAVGADSSLLRQASAGLGAGLAAAGTGLAVAAIATPIVAGTSLGAALGVSAAAGASSGPLAVVAVPVALCIGIAIWYAETFPAGHVRTPEERAAGAKIMRDAARDAFVTLQWLDMPEHQPQRAAAIAAGWYGAGLDLLSHIDDNNYGGHRGDPGDDALYAAAMSFKAAHTDPLASFPVPDATREAMRLTMGKAGVFVGTAAQIAATKKAVHFVRRQIHLYLLPPKSRYSTVGPAQKVLQMLGTKPKSRYSTVDPAQTLSQILGRMTTPELRASTARATTPAKKPEISTGAKIAAAAAAVAGYFLFL